MEIAIALIILVYILVKFQAFSFRYISKKEYEHYHDYLSKRFRYYCILIDDKERKKFIKRMLYMKDKKQFYSREGTVISEDMRILFSAAFTQITFGYDKVQLYNFDEVYIYPKTFYSRLVGAEVKGLTLKNGRIHLSWEDFLNGYIDEEDNINLALHELAHALYVDRFAGYSLPEWEHWENIATEEFNRMRNVDDHHFREYAETNMNEFWAVCVENFFEQPHSLREKLPHLYFATVGVLKQDMAVRKLSATNS